MQFLESKAGDEGKGSASKKSPKSAGNKKQQAAHSRRRSSPPPTHHTNSANMPTLQAPQPLHHPFTPPMNPEDQPFFPSPSPPAVSPPPFQAYQGQYSPPSDGGYYGASAHPVTTWMGAAALTTTAAPTLPPMNHFADAASAYNSSNSKGNESMSFAAYGDYSLGVPAAASPYDSNPHVSSHYHQHYHHQTPRSSSSQQETGLLPPVSTFPSYGGSSSDIVSSSSSLPGHLAAPDLDRSRYPPPPPARV